MSKNPKIANRKFYNKWLYKVSLQVKHSYGLRRALLSDVRPKNQSVLLNALTDYFLTVDVKLYSIRSESSILDIYTNDLKIYEEILSKFGTFLRDCFVPNDKLLSSTDDSHMILAKKYPHDRYHYKIFLQPHRLSDRQKKRDYISWLEKQGDKVKITDNVKDWFIKTDWNWDRRYMYAENEQMLLMLKLKNPEVLGTVYRFQIYDK
jgi:hypothetical protein